MKRGLRRCITEHENLLCQRCFSSFIYLHGHLIIPISSYSHQVLDPTESTWSPTAHKNKLIPVLVFTAPVYSTENNKSGWKSHHHHPIKLLKALPSRRPSRTSSRTAHHSIHIHSLTSTRLAKWAYSQALKTAKHSRGASETGCPSGWCWTSIGGFGRRCKQMVELTYSLLVWKSGARVKILIW